MTWTALATMAVHWQQRGCRVGRAALN